MNENIAIETVIVLPRNQFYFRYQINNGVHHTIKKEDAFKYFSQFISRAHYMVLQDYLQRFLPFIIIVAQDKIIELKKKISDNEFFQKQLKEDLQSKLKVSVLKENKKQESIPNDNLLNDIFEKVLK